MRAGMKEVQDEISALKRIKDETPMYIDEEYARKREKKRSKVSSYNVGPSG
jgi:hypothetical protein